MLPDPRLPLENIPIAAAYWDSSTNRLDQAAMFAHMWSRQRQGLHHQRACQSDKCWWRNTGEWEGLEEIESWPEEDEGQGICGDEGGPMPP